MGSIFDYTSPIDAFMQQGNNALEQQGKISGNALERLRVQQAQMDYDNNNALRKAFADSIGADGQPDYSKVTTALIQYGKPDLAVNVMNARRAQDAYESFGKFMGGQQQPQQPAMTPDQTTAMNAVGQLSPQDKATLKADMAKNPQAPTQFVGATQDTPQFGIGLPLNQGAINAGMSPPNQQPANQGNDILSTIAPAMKLALGSGGPDAMAKAAAIYADAFKPTSVREKSVQGHYGLDGKFHADYHTPDIGKGMTLDQNGAAQVVQNYPEYASLLQDLEKKIANKNELKMVPDANNVMHPTSVGNLLGDQQPGIRPPGMQNAPIVPGINDPAQPTGYGPSLSQESEQKAFGETSNKQAMSITEAADKAVVMKGKLQDLRGIVQGMQTGPMTNYKIEGKKLINGIASSLGFQPFDGDISSFDKLKKETVSMGTGAAREMGAKEAASIVQMIMDSYPNAEMTKDALLHVTNSLEAMSDYSLAKSSALTKWRQDHGNSAQGFEPDFISKVNPAFYALPYMNEQEKGKFFQGLKDSNQLGAFIQKYQSFKGKK